MTEVNRSKRPLDNPDHGQALNEGQGRLVTSTMYSKTSRNSYPDPRRNTTHETESKKTEVEKRGHQIPTPTVSLAVTVGGKESPLTTVRGQPRAWKDSDTNEVGDVSCALGRSRSVGVETSRLVGRSRLLVSAGTPVRTGRCASTPTAQTYLNFLCPNMCLQNVSANIYFV